MTKQQRTVGITLWDSRGDPPANAGVVYCWNGHEEQRPFLYSILRYVETHSERLRGRYIAWIHELGESQIRGRRLIDILAWDEGLSYWWMTSFVERSPWKSPGIIDAIRLLALEEILLREKPDKLNLVSSNRCLHKVVVDLCQRVGVAYNWVRPAGRSLRSWNLKGLFRALPQSFQGLIWLARYLGGRWPFRYGEKGGWFRGSDGLFVCSFFGGVDPKAAKQGRFESSLWAGLQPLLNDVGRRGNWLQLFVASDAGPTPGLAMKWARCFNQQKGRQGAHTFLDAYLSPGIVVWVIAQWLRLVVTSWRLRQVRNAFRPHGSQISLWPVMRRDWVASMRGPDAVNNLMWLRLFDVALSDLPHQAVGLYAHENQAWERALIRAWRKHGHGQLIAVAHSTVRFWDLRYFADPRTVRSSGAYRMPQPDRVALNGQAAIDAFRSVGFPEAAILECEALRYNYLRDLPRRPASTTTTGGPIKVLVLGDYTRSGTVAMLKLLEAVVLKIPTVATYTVKPHPNYIVVAENYPSLDLTVATEPLSSLLIDYDVALSGNLTSAAVDAYLAGLRVVVTLDATSMNFSPLRDQTEVNFVSTPDELVRALQAAGRERPVRPDPGQMFFLDPSLPRWQRALGCG